MDEVPILEPRRRKGQRPSQPQRLDVLRGLGKGFKPKEETGLVVAQEADVEKTARRFSSKR
jgi:hypothetical protein